MHHFGGQPNARGQARPKAEATEERTLEGVACTPLFGMALATVVVPYAGYLPDASVIAGASP